MLSSQVLLKVIEEGLSAELEIRKFLKSLINVVNYQLAVSGGLGTCAVIIVAAGVHGVVFIGQDGGGFFCEGCSCLLRFCGTLRGYGF